MNNNANTNSKVFPDSFLLRYDSLTPPFIVIHFHSCTIYSMYNLLLIQPIWKILANVFIVVFLFFSKGCYFFALTLAKFGFDHFAMFNNLARSVYYIIYHNIFYGIQFQQLFKFINTNCFFQKVCLFCQQNG